MQQIADWLEKLGMSEYAQRFAENGIDLSRPTPSDRSRPQGYWSSWCVLLWDHTPTALRFSDRSRGDHWPTDGICEGTKWQSKSCPKPWRCRRRRCCAVAASSVTGHSLAALRSGRLFAEGSTAST